MFFFIFINYIISIFVLGEDTGTLAIVISYNSQLLLNVVFKTVSSAVAQQL